ncbi:MAG: hypothetical protein HY672_01730 [Chloroflexi bacterium]|nr:hypothetical protein [Chloroflexota bacterium]
MGQSPMGRQQAKQRAKSWLQNQQGITGLETAIVLIAFVVVSSVFAFAALSTGLFTSDKSKETIQAGLSEARGSLELRGSVIAEDTDSSGEVDELYFQVANAAGGENIDLTPGSLVIRYQDADQAVVFDTEAELTVAGVGNADADLLLEPGELYQITLNSLEANLTPDLGTSTTFTLQVLPPKGASLNLERTTPVLLDIYNDLK